MEYLLPILVVIAMLATLGVLFMGVFGMARRRDGTGTSPGMRSNKLMQWRVLLQFAALILFAIFMMLYRR
jgi:hypothetical protein